MVDRFETLRVTQDNAVLFVEMAAPPMNLLGPELIRDLVLLVRQAEADTSIHVLVFKSADPDYFMSHIDIVRMKELKHQTAKLAKDAPLGVLFRRLSVSRLVTIAQIEGRACGAGSEFALACDMRFAASESAIFCQPEQGFGLVPGAGGIQHLARLVGRGRALEIMLSAADYDAAMAERYGWINRAMPAAALGDFVRSLAHRIAKFPLCGQRHLKERMNAITLAPVVDFDCDSDIFVTGAATPEAQSRVQAALKRGLQTPSGELALSDMLAEY